MIGKMTTERFGSRGQMPTAAAWLLIVLGLFLFWLAVVVILWATLSPGNQPARMPSGIDAGIAANGARWTALGDYYITKHAEVATDASTARYQALAGHYAASQDRWTTLGEYCTNKRAGAAAAASSARYQALGDDYGTQPNDPASVSAQRWTALGAHCTAQRAEAAASASSARYQALGSYYGASRRVISSERYPCEDCVSLTSTCSSDQST